MSLSSTTSLPQGWDPYDELGVERSATLDQVGHLNEMTPGPFHAHTLSWIGASSPCFYRICVSSLSLSHPVFFLFP